MSDTSLKEALDGWAKQTEMYEQAIKERDEWKACAEELWDRLKGRDEPLRLALLAAAMNADERNEWKQRAEKAEAATAGMVPIEDVKPLLERISSDIGNHYCAEIPAFLAKHGDKLK